MPWRTFRWHRGQKHYSGTYWSATQNAHVVYESRLELARPLLADFHTSMSQIVAQPFLLVASVDGKQRKHIPDYLLITNDGPVVVDVKPRQHLTKSVVVRTFAWTRKAVESRGWRYEVWSEAPPVFLGNVRFLAGYRRRHLFESAHRPDGILRSAWNDCGRGDSQGAKLAGDGGPCGIDALAVAPTLHG